MQRCADGSTESAGGNTNGVSIVFEFSLLERKMARGCSRGIVGNANDS